MTKVLFIGSKQMGLDCLKTIHGLAPSSLAGVVTIDDASDTRSVYPAFRRFADEEKLPLFVAENRRHAEEIIATVRPDIGLVVGWYWLISKETLQKVRRGILGIHNSLLPRYRGGAPLVWAIIHGESQVGFTLFSFTEGMDDGDVWGQRTVSVGPDDYVADISAKLANEAVALLAESWGGILEDRVKPLPQDHARATFCALRTPEDGEINWTKPAKEIHNFIRAQSDPYPGAFSHVAGNRKLTIWRASPVDVRFDGTPGQVAQIRSDGVYVIGGDNRPLLIECVSLDGQAKAPATEVLRSLKIRLQPRAPIRD